MEYYRYFELFLSIEDELASYMRQLQFSSKTESLYSPRISLLLLQTCPVIESYMAQLSTKSPLVMKHPLYKWEGAYSLWDSEKGKIKEKDGFRLISNFPKFAYVVEKVFGLSSKDCRFYYSERFKKIGGDAHFRDLNPFGTLKKFDDFVGMNLKKGSRFPTGLDTPVWWTAYNKIKHDMDEAEKRVSYKTSIEALGGLFVLLALCDAEYEVLEENGLIVGGVVKTKLFSCKPVRVGL